jgi:hypothetical protein
VVRPPSRAGAPTARDLMTEWKVVIPLGMGVGVATGLLAAADPFLVVLDHRRRPPGVVCGSKSSRRNRRTSGRRARPRRLS